MKVSQTVLATDYFQIQGQSISFAGKLKSEEPITKSSEKMKSKKCMIIKRSSEQFAEVIESSITVTAFHLFR